MFLIYESYLKETKEAFKQLNVKKQQQGRHLKGTNDLGEIHCIAAARLLNANIICSNDGIFKKSL